jgi:tetratricopeptide (TPR) repeat protein
MAYKKAVQLNGNNAFTTIDLAWLLGNSPDASLWDPPEALRLARQAVKLAPNTAWSWYTLGLAHYRGGEWKVAIEALKRANELSNGGNASHHFVLAMAHAQLHEQDEARKWYDRATQWMEKNRSDAEEPRRLGAEADKLSELKKK